MTAKSRRHKLDKKRKSDEHPQPRRCEEVDGDSTSAHSRSRTGLIPRKREGRDAADESNFKAFIEACNTGKARIRSISLVKEGQGFPGSFLVDITPVQQILTRAALRGDDLKIEERVGRKGPYWNVEGLTELNVVDPREYDLLWGYPRGAKLYLNDSEKELLDRCQREWDEARGRSKEAVRTSGSSDDEASS